MTVPGSPGAKSADSSSVTARHASRPPLARTARASKPSVNPGPSLVQYCACAIWGSASAGKSVATARFLEAGERTMRLSRPPASRAIPRARACGGDSTANGNKRESKWSRDSGGGGDISLQKTTPQPRASVKLSSIDPPPVIKRRKPVAPCEGTATSAITPVVPGSNSSCLNLCHLLNV
ncbi:uncharacterized protein LOC143829894 [Paroedura picta]|uniref:uncharacterized protein LOC143829894 n=1 Tax=Paroedura picta TaxID=143630 RepID=UPI0040577734